MIENSILPPSWQIPDDIRSRLGANVGRQRTIAADGHLLLVLHAPPKPGDLVRMGRYFWRAPDGSWNSKDLGSGISALNRHLDEYEELIAVLDRQEHEARTADAYFDVLERLTPLHRSVRNLYRVLQEARKLCPEYRDIIDARDRAYSVERSADLLFNATRNALDFTVAKQAEQQASASHRMATAAHRLNILAAVFFPIITLTAIFGVDFVTVAAILGLDLTSIAASGLIPLVFLGVILTGLVVGGILTRFVNRPVSPPKADNGSTES